MDCRTARTLLDLARPSRAELDVGETEALDRHLNTCTDCDAMFRQEQTLDDHIGRAVRDVPVPADLRQRVLDRLAADHKTLWRQRALRVGTLAAAAAVLLVIGRAAYVKFVEPPLWPWDVEVERVDVWSQHPTPERVEDWFRANHAISLTAPRTFDGQVINYDLLAFYGLVKGQGGRTAPMLVFVNGSHRARVYLLPADTFDLAKLPTGQVPSSMGLRIDPRFPEQPPFTQADVFIYTDSEEGFKPFLVPPGRQG